MQHKFKKGVKFIFYYLFMLLINFYRGLKYFYIYFNKLYIIFNAISSILNTF
jgi:hypothetical protein